MILYESEDAAAAVTLPPSDNAMTPPPLAAAVAFNQPPSPPDHTEALPLQSPAAAAAAFKQPANAAPAAIAPPSVHAEALPLQSPAAAVTFKQPANAAPAAIALPSKQPAHLRKSRRHCRNNRPRKSPNTALANPDANAKNSTRTETISLTVTQLRREINDLQKLKDRHLDQVSDLKSMNKQLQTDLYDKSEEVSTALKEKKVYFLKIQSDMNEKQAEYLEMLNGKDARIKAMAQLHLVEISAKSAEVRKLTFKFNADRKTANTVSYFVCGT